MTKYNPKNAWIEKPEWLQKEGIVVFNYRHENGYVQCRMADDQMFDENATLIGQYEHFKSMIKNGSNRLYKAYSMLPANLINKEGNPEIDMDFEDAEVFIKTGKLPSAEKLQANEATKGQIRVDQNKIDALTDLFDEIEADMKPNKKVVVN